MSIPRPVHIWGTTMSSAPSAPESRPADNPSLPPPEPRFWQRYSPHHEFPISSFSSLVIHGLVAGILVWLGFQLLRTEARQPLTMGVIAVAGDPGGSPGQAGSPDGDSPTTPGPEMAAASHPTQPPEAKSAPSAPAPLPAPRPDELPDLKIGRTIPLDPSNPGFRELNNRRQQIEQRLAQADAARRRGTGGLSDSGTDRGGIGDGSGPSSGPGPGGPSPRAAIRHKRSQRWVMLFNTRDGADYLQQLAGLGAILAVPDPRGGFRVYRELRRRAPAEPMEDINQIDRIRWDDDDPRSIASVAAALGIFPTPPAIAAFFPQELENELARLEHDYAGRTEDEIRETRFEILREGGRYVPVVRSQR